MSSAPVAGKLSEHHLTEIARQAALGKSQREIRDALRDGLRTANGDQLRPVEVSRQAVQQRLASDEGRALRRRWMKQLYGELHTQPAAYPGERLRRLDGLYIRAIREADGADSPSLRLRALAEARAAVDAMGRIAEQAEPTLRLTATEKTGTRLEASGSASALQLDPADLDQLARDVSAAKSAGLLDPETEAFLDASYLRGKLDGLPR